MFLLYRIEYPDRRLLRRDVENAWTAAGLPQPVPVFEADDVGRDELQGLVGRTLESAGGTASAEGDGDWEVPDEAEALLQRLEDFHDRLFPEFRSSPSRNTFYYERPEMLGEF